MLFLSTIFQKFLNPWVIFGLFSQFVFFMRFVVQWYVSEKKKKSTIPVAFWWLSIAGTILLLIYSLHIGDIVFIAANCLSFAIYIRNLMLIEKQRKNVEVQFEK